MKRELIVIFIVLLSILVVSGCTSTTTTTPAVQTPAPVVTNNTQGATGATGATGASGTNGTNGATNNYYNTTNTQNGRNNNPQYPNNSPNTVNVNMQNNAFNPSAITILVGDTVRWTNMDSVQHEVRGSIFDSGVMSPNASFEFTFTQPGTYNYACAIHPSMQGQIIVQ